MRTCPRCTFPLTPYTHERFGLDHCHRCGGSFLDPTTAAAQFGPEVHPQFWKQSYVTKQTANSHMSCPRCGQGMVAYDIEFAPHTVQIDDCSQCHGMWLDADEGPALRAIIADAEQHAQHRQGRKGTVLGYIFQLLTQFPIEVWNPVRRRPYAIYSLLVALLGLYLWESEFTASFARYAEHLLMVPATIAAGEELQTLLTAGFFHGGWMHLIGNGWMLWLFGDNVEDTLGVAHFIGLYITALIAGNVAHLAAQWGTSYPLLGASGAISGLMGAYVVLFPRVKVWAMVLVFIRVKLNIIWYMVVWIGWQILMMYTTDEPVAWFAHFGGFAAGAVYGMIAKPSYQHRIYQPRRV